MLHLDLSYSDCFEKKYPFEITLNDEALKLLTAEALQGSRIYELMQIRRPGDLWKYLWVQVHALPSSCSWQMPAAIKNERETHGPARFDWPEEYIPLTKFTKFFYAAGDDTNLESEAWLSAKNGSTFRRYFWKLFTEVRATQETIHQSPDLLVREELSAIASSRHARDFDAEPPFKLTPPGAVSQLAPQYTEAFYEQFTILIASPQVRSVGVWLQDYKLYQIACREQRKRALASGNKIGRDLIVSTGGADDIDCVTDWNAPTVYHDMGMDYSDLTVLFSAVVRKGGRFRRPLWLTPDDAGEVEGYVRTTGEGWTVYKDPVINEDFTASSASYRQGVIDMMEKDEERRAI